MEASTNLPLNVTASPADDLRFANPLLQRFATATKPRPLIYLAKGVVLEIGAWLLVPAYLLGQAVINIIFDGGIGDISRMPFHELFLALFVVVILAISVPSIFLLIKVGRRTRRLGSRYRIDNRKRLSWDPRNPVLYLRSFYDDYTDDPHRRDGKTPEELLTYALEDVGPVVAVGKPGEDLPLIGAARIYLRDEDWQSSVEHLMKIAPLVVLHANISEGLLWELKQAKKTVRPERLLISFLAWKKQDAATRQKLYETFRARANDLLGGKLPAKMGKSSFLLFDSKWEPRLIEINWLKSLAFGGNLVAGIRETLRLHLSSVGVRVGLRNAFIDAVRVMLTAMFAGWLMLDLPNSATPADLYFLKSALSLTAFIVLVLPILTAALRGGTYLALRLRLRTTTAPAIS